MDRVLHLKGAAADRRHFPDGLFPTTGYVPQVEDEEKPSKDDAGGKVQDVLQWIGNWGLRNIELER